MRYCGNKIFRSVGWWRQTNTISMSEMNKLWQSSITTAAVLSSPAQPSLQQPSPPPPSVVVHAASLDAAPVPPDPSQSSPCDDPRTSTDHHRLQRTVTASVHTTSNSRRHSQSSNIWDSAIWWTLIWCGGGNIYSVIVQLAFCSGVSYSGFYQVLEKILFYRCGDLKHVFIGRTPLLPHI